MNNNQRVMRILRIILGLFLITYALNKFFQFLPAGYGEMPEPTQDFLDAVAAYLPALYIFEVVLALFLLLNKWTPAVLLVLFPLSVSFMIFSVANGDFLLAWPAILVALINVVLMWDNRARYKPLFN